MTEHDLGFVIRVDVHLLRKLGGGLIVAFNNDCSYDICNYDTWATRAREV